MARIAVTGAAGNVGRTTLAGLASTGHEVVPITHREHDDINGIVADVTDLAATKSALEHCDIVIHLAGNPDPEAAWQALIDVNIDGTRTVYEAAVEADLNRVVFASTNHVTHAAALPPGGTWDEMVTNPDPVHIQDPVQPDSFYAVSKIAGEALGDYYAHRHGIEALDLRIGWLLTVDQLADMQEAQTLLEDEQFNRGAAAYARAVWLSPRDCRHGMRRAVDAELPEDHVTVNLCSRNSERFYSVIDAMRVLDYAPRDDSSAALDLEAD